MLRLKSMKDILDALPGSFEKFHDIPSSFFNLQTDQTERDIVTEDSD
jgi:hypothetical protein